MSKDVKEVLDSIAEWSDKDSRPRGIVQRFWQHFYLRVLVGLIVIGGLIGGGLWYGYSLLYTERLPLVSYVPSEAWLYVEFDLQTQEWNRLVSMNEQLVTDVNQYFTAHGLDQRVLDVVDRLGLIGFYNDEARAYELVWIVRTDEAATLELYVPKNTFVRQLSENVVVFSQSEAVRDFSRRPQPMLSEIESGDNILWSGFMRPKQLQDALQHSSERRVDLRALQLLLDKGIPRQIPFTVHLADSGIIIASDVQVPSALLPKYDGTLADVLVTEVVVLDTLETIEKLFADLPLSEYHWQQRTSSIDQQYQFDSRGLFSLFNEPMTALVRAKDLEVDESLTDHIIAQGLFGTEWLFMFNEPVSAEKESLFKESARRILAQEDPDEIERTLPDDTISHELVVRPESYAFAPHNQLSDTEYIATRDGAHHLFFSHAEEGLHISNSAELLADAQAYTNEPTTCVHASPATGVFSADALKNVPFLSHAQSVMFSMDGSSFASCIRLE